MRAWINGVAAMLVAAVTGLGVAGGCSLGNVSRDDCTTDDQCAAAFGLGSVCDQGFCTEPAGCTTGHDCRKATGAGVCVDGACAGTFPKAVNCDQIYEPPELFDMPATGPDAPLVIGGIFSLDEPNDLGLSQAVRLAVREINRKGGMSNGRKLGIVFCNNDPGNMATGDDRIPLNNAALDYLAGQLGVPYVVGPLSSSDSIRLINRLKEKSYPTVIISPSATSPDLTLIDDRITPNQENGLFWRTCPSDLLQGKALAVDVIPATQNLAIVYLQDAYGEGLANVVATQRTGTGVTKLYPFKDTALTNPAELDAIFAKAVSEVPNLPAPGQAGVLLIPLRGPDAVVLLEALAKTTLASADVYATDGAKDAMALLETPHAMEVDALIAKMKGTAPASPSGSVYNLFATNLAAEFPGIDASKFSFLAQAYDATYVGAYGTVWAAGQKGDKYDGVDVALGLGQLSAGAATDILPTSWQSAQGALSNGMSIDVNGTSGPLQFDPSTGEAPGPIEIWTVDAMNKVFVTLNVVTPM